MKSEILAVFTSIAAGHAAAGKPAVSPPSPEAHFGAMTSLDVFGGRSFGSYIRPIPSRTNSSPHVQLELRRALGSANNTTVRILADRNVVLVDGSPPHWLAEVTFTRYEPHGPHLPRPSCMK